MSDEKSETKNTKPEKETQDNVVDLEKAKEEISPEAKIKEELDKAKKDYLYLYAEFENYRKKAIQERTQLVKYANENILRDLLNIMDNFKLAIDMEVSEKNLQSFVDGVNMISKELENLVNKFGVSKIKTDKDFDPNLHEALSTEESGEVEAGNILRVYKDGYKYHDRLLRPAQVVIASEKSED